MYKRVILAVVFSIGSILTAAAQDGSGFSLTLEPSVTIPFWGTESAQRFTIGGQGSLSADYVLPGLPFLDIGGGFDFLYAPGAYASLMTLGLSAGAGVRLRILPTLSATLYGRGGYSFGLLGSAMALNPYVRGGLDLTLYLGPSFRLTLGGEYIHQFAATGAQYQGIAARLSAGLNFSQMNQKSNVEIRDIIIQPIFPVFYKYYNENKVGTAVIKNGENGPIQNVKVTFFVKQYMDAPKECIVIPELKQGEEREVPLYALFTRSILSVLEPTKAQAEIMVTYTYVESGREATTSSVAAITHRNGMTWDDDRKVASFATVNDPAVMQFAKQIAGLARSSGWQSTDAGFRQALGIFEGLGLFGIRYVVDPNTPHAEFEKNTSAVDYLQFPVQTLQFRAGDCDDLSILTTALLEAVGVETAFITAPGHIFMAFAIGMTPDQARAFFSHPDDLIEKDGRMWVPIEVTAVQDGFLRAWQLGAREWRESTARGEAGFWPTHDAWKLYEPVAIIGTESSVEMPKTDALLGRYTAAMQAFIDREIAPRVEKINAEISAGKQSPGPQNKLGVLYARYGVYDKAEDAFRASIKIKESAPAYVNLGNILMMKKDFAGALKAYQSAQRISPTDTNALIGLVRSTYELDDRGSSSHWLDVLNTIDQAVAQKYAYVKPGDTTGTRAGQAGQEDMPWVE